MSVTAGPAPLTGLPRKQGGKKRAPLEPRGALANTILGFGLLYFVIPIIWLFIASTKTQADLLGTPAFTFTRFNLVENLRLLFAEEDGIYGRWLFNSIRYAVLSALGATALASMAGYGLARFEFRGKNFVDSAILGMIMVPATALVLPTYLIASKLHIINTMWAVVLPSMLSPFGAFLIRVYVAESVPKELLDAARVDRASEWRTFWNVALPVMKPAIVTVFLFTLVATWNNFFLPLVMLSEADLQPLTVGLTTWYGLAQQEGATRALYNLIVTGSLLAIVPLIIAFICLQRFWRGGVTTGSLK